MRYTLPYAGGYFRVEIPIGICEKGKPTPALSKILEKAGKLWKRRGYGLVAVKDYLQKHLGGVSW
jgi:hypothetical protein